MRWAMGVTAGAGDEAVGTPGTEYRQARVTKNERNARALALMDALKCIKQFQGSRERGSACRSAERASTAERRRWASKVVGARVHRWVRLWAPGAGRWKEKKKKEEASKLETRLTTTRTSKAVANWIGQD